MINYCCLKWKNKNEQLQKTNQELLEALEYSSSYLDDNELNSIGSGSKAHREMQRAITNAKQILGDSDE